MCPYSGGTYREENEIRTQEIKDRPMANRKYDYSEDVLQSAEATSETAKTSEATTSVEPVGIFNVLVSA